MNKNVSEKDDYLLLSLSKIRHKKFELYVVAKVLFELNDPDIEYVCQQYVKTEKGRNFVDLYFPQFKTYLKINEHYHATEQQQVRDTLRDREILEASGLVSYEIAVYDPITKATLPLTEIDKAITIFCDYIRDKKQQALTEKNFAPWVVGASRYALDQYLLQTHLRVDDNVIVRRQHEVLRLFGANYKGWQRAWWRRNENQAVWFPKLYETRHSIWRNALSDDGSVIVEEKKDGSAIENPPSADVSRIVFAHYKNNFGQTVYKFTGVFKTSKDLSTRFKHVHLLTTNEVKLRQ